MRKAVKKKMVAKARLGRENQDVYLEQSERKVTEYRGNRFQTVGSNSMQCLVSDCVQGVSETARYLVKAMWWLLAQPQDVLSRVELGGAVLGSETRLRDMAIATENSKLNNGLYLMMFRGLPGTGGTMFTKKLARHSENTMEVDMPGHGRGRGCLRRAAARGGGQG
jgi:hypothetical protein